MSRIRHLLDLAVFVPDRMVLWLPYLIPAVRRAVRQYDADLVICSGPPFSSMIGTALGILGLRVRFIADYRDPWSSYPEWAYGENYRYRAGIFVRLRHRLETFLEACVLRRADGLSFVTPELLRRTLALCPKPERVEARVVRNGVVREVWEAIERRRVTRRAGDKIVLTHVGNFYDLHTLRHFLDGLERFESKWPELAERLEVRLFGTLKGDDVDRIESRRRRVAVKVFGRVPYADGLRALANADALLLCLPPWSNVECWIPMKTYAYLTSGNPILAVIPDGELRKFLGDYPSAIVSAPDAPDDVAEGLRMLVSHTPRASSPSASYFFDSTFPHFAGILSSLTRAR